MEIILKIMQKNGYRAYYPSQRQCCVIQRFLPKGERKKVQQKYATPFTSMAC
jgi:hypothetical protein